MDCFCEDHKFIGCNKCIITEHRRCDSVTTTKEYFDKQKNNSNIQSIDKSLVEAANSMDLMVKSFNDKEQDMQRCKQVELNSLIILRDRLNGYLDTRQMELTQDLNSSYKTESEKVDLSTQRCNRLKREMLITKEALQMAVKREDDVDTIRLLLRGQTEAGACRDLLKDFSRSLTSVHIKHDIGSDLHNLNENSTLSLGKIVIESKPQTLPNGIHFVKTLLNSQAKSIKTIILPMDKPVLTSALQKQKQLGKLKMNDRLALRRERKRERKAKCAELRIKRYETTSDKKYTESVAHQRNPDVQVLLLSTGLIVVFSDQSFIWLLSEDGQELDKFQTRWIPLDLCVLDADTIAVTSGFQSLQIVGVQANKLRQLHLIQTSIRCYGVTVDREGNVYICDQVYNNVVQISADGSKVRKLLTSKDGINSPTVIAVCGDKLVVTSISPQQQDVIRVFQLN